MRIMQRPLSRIVMCGTCERQIDTFFGGKSEGKKSLALPRCRREGNIKMWLEEKRWWGDVDWIRLVLDAGQWQVLVRAVINIRAS